MRYSTYNAIPQYPKSKKHPYETLENTTFLDAPSANAQIDQICHKIEKIGHLMYVLVLN